MVRFVLLAPMERSLRLAVLPVIASAIVGGCTPSPVSLTAATDLPGPAERLTTLTALDERVGRVAQRLFEANTDLCPVVRLSAGWALHSARQYSTELRPHAERRFGLEGDLPGVVAAPPGSAAAAAGVRQGDLLLTVGPLALDTGDGRPEPDFKGLEENIRKIDAALAEGSTRFTLRRDGQRQEAVIEPRRACGYVVQLNPSDELNARADGRRLFISTALSGFTESDDELAVILGHELAHHVLRHRHWSDTGGAARQANQAAWQGEGGGGNAEQQADRVGLYLMARAGYDPAVAAPFWRRFGASNWRVRFPQIGHASAGARALALEGVRREIENKRQAGAELLP